MVVGYLVQFSSSTELASLMDQIKGILLYEMGDKDGVLELPYYCTIKVHHLMCVELKKFIDRILLIFSAIELARPRCSSGLQALCSLHAAVDKAKLLIQHCSESSKFYLAIMGEKILSRCEKIRNTLEICLRQIQDMVPSLLAAKIYGIIEDLRMTKFSLESAENEAGVAILALLRDISASDSIKNVEVDALKLAALRLNITSPLALLIEKRSIKRLLEKVGDTDSTKKNILRCLLYLLRKYGQSILQHQTEGNAAQNKEPEPYLEYARNETDSSLPPEAPEEFKCPISSRLLYDPVVIATGMTFERVWIEKWFSEGHERCPITLSKLDHLSLTPNTVIKSLISKWCKNHGIAIPDPCTQSNAPRSSGKSSSSSCSIASFGSSMKDLNLPVSNLSLCSSNTSWSSLDDKTGDGFDGLPQMNADSCRVNSSTYRHGTNLAILSELAALPWRSQCKALEDIRNQLKDNVEPCHLTFSDNCVKPLIRFMKDAREFCDVKAQKDGAEVLAVILTKNRNEKPLLDEDAVSMLVSFLDSEIIGNALAIMELLSSQEHYKSQIVASGVLPSIIKVLDSPIRKFDMVAMKILSNLSSNTDVGHHMVYLGCIPKLAPFLGDHMLAGYCVKIIRSLCNTKEEARTAVAETNLCVSSIAKLLEEGSQEEQEDMMDVLLSLCHEHAAYCELAMREDIIQSIVDLSVNGKSKVKVIAMELLQLIGHVMQGDASECSVPSNDDNQLEKKKLPFKAFGFLGRKMSVFSKLSR